METDAKQIADLTQMQFANALLAQRLSHRNDRPPSQWELDAVKERGSVRVSVCSQQSYHAGPFCFGADHKNGTLAEVIDSLTAIRDSIPAEYRAEARCEISSVSGYEGDHSASISICYDRPETDDEWAARRKGVARRQALVEAAERRQLDALKAKFGE